MNEQRTQTLKVMLILIVLVLTACDSTSTPAPTPTPTAMPTPWWTPVVEEINGMAMVYVPEGCFMMGNTYKEIQQPIHEVCLSAFWIGQTEVTNAQYAECVEAGACSPPRNRVSFDDSDYADHPVVHISWVQADVYAQWWGGSLPTEAQWEYTACGSYERMYPWGDTRPNCELANVLSCVDDTTPVGSYPLDISWVGAQDMAGNAIEWIADEYGTYTEDAQTDPTGPTGQDWRSRFRILRGGGYRGVAIHSRCANRGAAHLQYYRATHGFRVALPSQ